MYILYLPSIYTHHPFLFHVDRRRSRIIMCFLEVFFSSLLRSRYRADTPYNFFGNLSARYHYNIN